MSKTFAARLNRLFDTVYPPGRGPHTSAEVIAARQAFLREASAGYHVVICNTDSVPEQELAFVADMSGVWSTDGTRDITSKPTNAARTRIASSVNRSIYTTAPSRTTVAPATRMVVPEPTSRAAGTIGPGQLWVVS